MIKLTNAGYGRQLMDALDAVDIPANALWATKSTFLCTEDEGLVFNELCSDRCAENEAGGSCVHWQMFPLAVDNANNTNSTQTCEAGQFYCGSSLLNITGNYTREIKSTLARAGVSVTDAHVNNTLFVCTNNKDRPLVVDEACSRNCYPAGEKNKIDHCARGAKSGVTAARWLKSLLPF